VINFGSCGHGGATKENVMRHSLGAFFLVAVAVVTVGGCRDGIMLGGVGDDAGDAGGVMSALDAALADASPGGDGSVGDGPQEQDANVCTISASNYDDSCSSVADCALVPTGNACRGGPQPQCWCPDAVIRDSALASYHADVAAVGGPPVNVCACPITPVTCCVQGRCQLGSACPADAGLPLDATPADATPDVVLPADAAACTISASNYDDSCSSASDCAVIAQGDFCAAHDAAGCYCPDGAISSTEVAKYNSDVAAAGGPPNNICACIAIAGPCCLQGKCHVGPTCMDGG
jgi:hypothetical protein